MSSLWPLVCGHSDQLEEVNLVMRQGQLRPRRWLGTGNIEFSPEGTDCLCEVNPWTHKYSSGILPHQGCMVLRDG